MSHYNSLGRLGPFQLLLFCSARNFLASNLTRSSRSTAWLLYRCRASFILRGRNKVMLLRVLKSGSRRKVAAITTLRGCLFKIGCLGYFGDISLQICLIRNSPELVEDTASVSWFNQ